MQKKNGLISLIFFTTLILQSCTSTIASIHNQQILEQTEEQYVSNEMKRIYNLNLTEEQKLEANKVFTETFNEKRENAHKEKSKEINNKASFNNLKYIIYKDQVKIERILTKEQLIDSRKSNYGLNGDQLEKLEKDLSKMGYNINL